MKDNRMVCHRDTEKRVFNVHASGGRDHEVWMKLSWWVSLFCPCFCLGHPCQSNQWTMNVGILSKGIWFFFPFMSKSFPLSSATRAAKSQLSVEKQFSALQPHFLAWPIKWKKSPFSGSELQSIEFSLKRSYPSRQCHEY